jgi:hypothetical protein
MGNIQTFVLKIEYNAKLVEYTEWVVEIQKEHLTGQLTTRQINNLIDEGYNLTVECDNLLQQLRERGLVTHDQVVKGFDIESQQLSLAS